jgi:hypothetical protein
MRDVVLAARGSAPGRAGYGGNTARAAEEELAIASVPDAGKADSKFAESFRSMQ